MAAHRRKQTANRRAQSAQRWAERWESPWRSIFLPTAIAVAVVAALLLVALSANVGELSNPAAEPESVDVAPMISRPVSMPTPSAGATDAERQVAEYLAKGEHREAESAAAAEARAEAAAKLRQEQVLAEIERRGAQNRAKIEAERRARIERERPINTACTRADSEFREAEYLGETLPQLTKSLLQSCSLRSAADRLPAVEAILPEIQAVWQAEDEAESVARAEAERLESERRQAEAERRRQAELEAERQRQAELEAERQRQAELEAERQRQAEAERQHQEAERQRQAKLEAERQRQALWDSAKVVGYDDLFRNNEQHVGSNVRFRGEVVQVIHAFGESYQLRVNVTLGEFFWDDTVYVHYEGPRLLEDDIINFVGRVDGLITYESIFGARITIPEVTALDVRREGA